MKIHGNLKWQTILDRLNKESEYEKYYLDNAGAIYKDGVHLFKMCGNKNDFIDQETCSLTERKQNKYINKFGGLQREKGI